MGFGTRAPRQVFSVTPSVVALDASAEGDVAAVGSDDARPVLTEVLVENPGPTDAVPIDDAAEATGTVLGDGDEPRRTTSGPASPCACRA